MSEHKLSCGHTNTDDLTAGLGEIGPNIICHVCGRHYYKGREWSREEWDDYVNATKQARL